MKRAEFNFNNETDVIAIDINDDGSVTIPGPDGPLAAYNSVQHLAESYALARDVRPDNLKNWTLLEHGDVYSFVLRAGTAGISVSEAEERLDEAFAGLAGRHHALSIARAKEQVMADGAEELTDALVHCTETEIARDVYDALIDIIEGTEAAETAVAVVEEPVDTRSDLEKYIDSMEESVPGSIRFFVTIAGLSAEAGKAELLEVLGQHMVFSNVDNLKAIYSNAINDAVNEGIGVDSVVDALTIITQTAIGKKDDEERNRMVVAAELAKRNRVNVTVKIVGHTHIRKTAELVNLEELRGADLVICDNVPCIVRFSEDIDAEIEAEREGRETEEVMNDDPEEYEDNGYDEDGYDEDEDENDGEGED